MTSCLLKRTHAFLQHLYVYAVLVFEAMATFVGQVSVLSLIALFGAATTAMVSHRCFDNWTPLHSTSTTDTCICSW